MTKIDLILKTIRENPEKSKSDIFDIVRKSGVSDRHFRRTYKDWKEGLYDEIVINVDLPKYRLEEDNEIVIFEFKGQELRVKEERVNRVFQLYTKQGLNLSTSQTINNSGVNVNAFHAIKQHLQLTKTSLPVSPIRLEGLTTDEVLEVVERSIQNVYGEDLNKAIETTRLRTLTHRTKRLYQDIQNRYGAAQDILEYLEVHYAEPIINRYSEYTGPTYIEEVTVAIGDLHIGANYDGAESIMSTNLATIIARLTEAAEEINYLKAGAVNLALAGDLIESVTGAMHPNTFMGMDKNLIGAMAIATAVDVISDFLSKINNLKQVRGVTGNHDRIGSKDLDPVGQAGLVIYEFLKRRCDQDGIIDFDYSRLPSEKDLEDFGYDPLKETMFVGDMAFLIGHGDKGWVNRVSDMILKLYREQRHNKEFFIPDVWYCITAHIHHNKIFKDDLALIHRSVGSIFSGNFYSKALGLDARPSFSMFWKNDLGSIKELTHRFSI